MTIEVEVSWTVAGDFASGRYSRAHQWRFDGGASVTASSSPAIVPLPFSDASAVDPEEALLAATASCHMLWFLDLARRAGLEVASYRDKAVAELGTDERGRTAVTRIILDPDIFYANRQPSGDQVAALHKAAHDHCFIANSLRCAVIVRGCSDQSPELPASGEGNGAVGAA